MLDLDRRTADVAAQIRRLYPDSDYAAYHAPRFATLIKLIAPHIRGRDTRVLDVGVSRLTDMLIEQFGIPVDSLDINERESGPRGTHYHFDLNMTQYPEQCRRDVGPYDIIVLAEVLEHLHTAPSLVLAYLRSLLEPGGLLFLQTPNALAWHKRLMPILGIHPYEQIRESVTNPGHFREYTLKELTAYAKAAGFHIVSASMLAYFDVRYADRGGTSRPRWISSGINVVNRVMPPPLRRGITLLLRRTGA